MDIILAKVTSLGPTWYFSCIIPSLLNLYHIGFNQIQG